MLEVIEDGPQTSKKIKSSGALKIEGEEGNGYLRLLDSWQAVHRGLGVLFVTKKWCLASINERALDAG